MSGCQVAECADPAAGRCHQCGRAICRSHRFAGRSETMRSDLCTECAQVEAHHRARAEQERRASLARITAIATALVADGLPPTRAFVWGRRTESRWWAIGELGRYVVDIPVRVGWPVGDFPWEGRVKDRQGTASSEVFVVPTFVDAEGQLAPLDTPRTTPLDNHLLTGEMCHDILATMEEISAAARSPRA